LATLATSAVAFFSAAAFSVAALEGVEEEVEVVVVQPLVVVGLEEVEVVVVVEGPHAPQPSSDLVVEGQAVEEPHSEQVFL